MLLVVLSVGMGPEISRTTGEVHQLLNECMSLEISLETRDRTGAA
jgi:hypothetical protein